MARLNDAVRASRYSTSEASIHVGSTTPAPSHPPPRDPRKQPRNTSTLTPSDDTSSDKENQDESVTSLRNQDMNKSTSAVNTASLPTPPPPLSSQRSSSKRRRIGEYSISNTSNSRTSQTETDNGTATTEFSRYYDPDQAPEVRRKVRKEYHDLARRFYGKLVIVKYA